MAHLSTVEYPAGTRMRSSRGTLITIVGYVFYGQCGLYYIICEDGQDSPYELCRVEIEDGFTIELEEDYV